MTLVEYLSEKFDAVKAGCSCPTPEFLERLPAPGVVLTDCVEHGRRRTQVGGLTFAGGRLWWGRQ